MLEIPLQEKVAEETPRVRASKRELPFSTWLQVWHEPPRDGNSARVQVDSQASGLHSMNPRCSERWVGAHAGRLEELAGPVFKREWQPPDGHLGKFHSLNAKCAWRGAGCTPNSPITGGLQTWHLANLFPASLSSYKASETPNHK